MTELAIIRPDEWNLPLFVHVLGAFTLVGTLVLAAGYLFAARRDGSLTLTRAGYRSLLLGAFPAFIVTRVGAEWIASEEGLDDSDLTWVTLGYASTDIGLLALIGATVAAGVAMRRARLAEAGGTPGRGTTIAAWLVLLLVVVYAVMIWLMATQPA
jgi:uncharacterized membrane protein